MVTEKEVADWGLRVSRQQTACLALTDLLDALAERLMAGKDRSVVESLSGSVELLRGVSSSLRIICDEMSGGV
jgi:hypothetical protein